MKLLTAETDLNRFFQKVRNARTRALLLDYDGTVAPFHIRRENALPHPAVVAVLNAILEANRTHVAIVSGRGIDDLLPLVSALTRVPEIWGSHGWQRRREDGTREDMAISQEAQDAISIAHQRAIEGGFLRQCECKPASIAVHWRGMDPDEQNELASKVRDLWGELSESPAPESNGDRCPQSPPLCWHEFDGGVELRVSGRDKGDAVRTMLSELGNECMIAYAGDDWTDEDAFAALGDRGLSILVRPDFRKTCATLWLESSEELVEFLTRWNNACTR